MVQEIIFRSHSFRENGLSFVFHDLITADHMNRVMLHPHSDEFFRFSEYLPGHFRWFVRASNYEKESDLLKFPGGVEYCALERDTK